MITAVLTSCSRHDLLQLTLDSFFRFNTAILKRLIVIEDGPAIPLSFRHRYVDFNIEWISTGMRVGQIPAIDYAYSRVDTPYIFHLQDDWEFYRSGFIERSLVVLEDNPKCVQVWIRSIEDTQGHPIDAHVYTSRGIVWRRMALEYQHDLVWHGFSFNPGLRRLADYISIGGYGVHVRDKPATRGYSENTIGSVYRRRDFFAAILCDEQGQGYVRHLGGDRHVDPQGSAST